MPAGDTLIQCAGGSSLHAGKESLRAAAIQRGEEVRRALHVDAMADGRQCAQSACGMEAKANAPLRGRASA